MTCEVEQCDRPVHGRGYCNMHLRRLRRHNDLTRDHTTPRASLEERFWAKVTKTDNCWLWTGALSSGYGRIGIGPSSAGLDYAHRISYRLHHGPIPEGLFIDHLCRVRRCVNPAHLEAVTQAENNRRAHVKAST